jgi:quinate dehydrogenase
MEEQRTQKFTYLVGVGVRHSIAPPQHDYVAQSLQLPWKFKAEECPTVDDAMRLFRALDFAGGVVTMPYKITIMSHLDGIDETAKLIGACNNVYRSADGQLRGTNTDWRGIKGCLESGTKSGTGSEGRGKPALLVGAGGAARAAVYALHRELGCNLIYVANRDEDEITALKKDTEVYGNDCEIVYLDTLERARDLVSKHGFPFFVVGTVPDFEPKSERELAAADILKYCLSEAPEKGALLDMCFNPRRTRTIKLAEQMKWSAVEGTHVIGHQIEEQYRLWCGSQESTPITPEIQKGAWKVLLQAADDSKIIN